MPDEPADGSAEPGEEPAAQGEEPIPPGGGTAPPNNAANNASQEIGCPKKRKLSTCIICTKPASHLSRHAISNHLPWFW